MKTKIILITALITCFVQFSFADYPIVSYRYIADPGSLVYNGRVYLYCSNDDENPVEGGYEMSSFICISSSDMKNWTDHGVVFDVPRDVAWANKCWAPGVAERDGSFYLYFGNGGSEIGVAVADNPLGPFTDAIGDHLINSSTPGVLPADNMWLFDPMTFIDDDGQAYCYFGGNGEDNMRVIKLNDDMISVDGAATQFTVPYFFEASWMHKYNNTYYFSYSTNTDNGLRIDYMYSDNPLTGFTYGGVVSNQPPNNNNNNHQAIFELNGGWYQAYHNRIVASQEGIPTGYRRNLCVDSIIHNADGSIETMVNTVDGLSQLQHVNPYQTVEAETMYKQNGIETDVCNMGGMKVTQIENGDWIEVLGVDFGSIGAATFTATVASKAQVGISLSSGIEVRLDAVDGSLIGTVPVSYTGGNNAWKTETIAIEEVTGVHNVFFVFNGEEANNLFDFDSWLFTEKTADQNLLAINTEVSTYKIDTVTDNNTSEIAVTAIYSNGNSEDITAQTDFTFDIENIISIENGLITGLEYDTVTVFANYNGISDSVMVIVKNQISEHTVTQLTTENNSLSLFKGTAEPITIIAEFEDGHSEDVTLAANYENPNPEIANIENGLVNAINVGEVDITASYQGTYGDPKSIVITIEVMESIDVWIEAECETVGSLWDIKSDNKASNSKYVEIKAGNENLDGAPTDAEALLSYTFDVDGDGSYHLYTRVKCASANDDSFWIKMDDGPFELWNGILTSSAWIWTNFTTVYNLSAGSHTLTIAAREDGAKLDKLWITKSGGDITGLGGDAEPCLENSLNTEQKQKVEIYPNPVNEELNFNLPNAKAEIVIYDIENKQVHKQTTNSNKVTLDMTNFVSGIYVVNITCQGKTYTEKIIRE